MEIRSWFEGLEIIEASSEILKNHTSNPTIMLEPGNKVYQLRGMDWSGYVLGGIMRTHEDEGEFFAPSALLDNSG